MRDPMADKHVAAIVTVLDQVAGLEQAQMDLARCQGRRERGEGCSSGVPISSNPWGCQLSGRSSTWRTSSGWKSGAHNHTPSKPSAWAASSSVPPARAALCTAIWYSRACRSRFSSNGTASASTQTVSVSGIRDDKLFVKIISEEAPIFKGVSRKTMVKTAKTTCRFLRSGFTIFEVVESMEDSGFTQNQSMTFVAGAIVFYCPDQEDNY
jgi:hypothetical protein